MARIGIQIKSSVLFVATKHNVCPAEKRTKRSSILLLRLVRFSAGQMLKSSENFLPLKKNSDRYGK